MKRLERENIQNCQKKSGHFQTPWVSQKRPEEIEKEEEEKEGSSQLRKVRFLAEGKNLPMQFEIIGSVRTLCDNIRQNENGEYTVVAELADCSGSVEVRILYHSKLFSNESCRPLLVILCWRSFLEKKSRKHRGKHGHRN